MKSRRIDEPRLGGRKRQYLPYVLEWECPECGEQRETDLSEKYLSYPTWGEFLKIPLFCMECDEVEPVKQGKLRPDVTVETKYEQIERIIEEEKEVLDRLDES